MDRGASSHLNFNASHSSTIFDKRLFPSVHVGDGKSIPVTNTCHSIIPSHHRPLHLYNVLVTPNIIKNLISVCQFTSDNNCTIKFDAFGFSVKDYLTRHILLRCDSSGDLYPITKPSTSLTAFLSTSASMWHQRLGHPGIVKPIDRLSLHTSSISPIPKNPSHTLKDPNWHNAMYDEYNALVKMALGYLYQGPQVAYLLIYLDDIILTASCPALHQQIIGSLNKEFEMTDLGVLNYFLGVFADHTFTSLFLSQNKYSLQLLECAYMVTCNPSRTPVDTESKLGPEGAPVGCPSTRSAKAVYRGVANVVVETAWLRNHLRELHSPLSTATLVYYDNVSVVYMSANPVQHQRTKHIEIDIHFVRDMVTAVIGIDSGCTCNNDKTPSESRLGQEYEGELWVIVEMEEMVVFE
ncbi:ribonuclease H-like domain-containing protein [Tanacetum coccineum]